MTQVFFVSFTFASSIMPIYLKRVKKKKKLKKIILDARRFALKIQKIQFLGKKPRKNELVTLKT